MTGSTNHLIIHGHFYQPPRENPWIDAIELQESAKPFHDWNERITEESYRPNANSRILGQGNRIIDIVNNYQYISFNFGPTLLHWIRRNAPDVYSAIIEADKQSLIHFSGHGNAIAQAYNHMILPLANKRDKVTQILWGLEDFKYHFDREAESIWLPETAIDHETLETLIDMRIKYIILSPHQALRVRRLQGHSKWADVSLGTIDTNQAYRCFAMDENGRKSHDRYIDILFYHADLSRGVAFDHLLKNAGRFADSIQHVFDGSRQRDRLVTICTDGETFGHHEPFGDMALAYLLHKEAVSRDFKLTNFGEFLEKHPPHHEVELKPGPNGEGTSWSCFHGVGRWYRDCGCSTGAMGNWNQKWRWNLRKSLDYLRDRLALIFSNAGGHYFLDPWAARDDYIHVITNRSPESMERFWGRNCNRNLSAAEKTICLQLLEMQLHAMLMYTSCAWFFADISGIETVQIMKYAARAIDYAYGFSNEMLEENFLEILKDAHSNLAQMGTGRDIYRRYVSPARFSFHRMANLYAINSFFQKDSEPPESVIYQYEITSRDQQRISTPRGDLCIGSVEIFHRTTHEKRAYAFLSRKLNDICFDTFVRWLEHADFDYESAKRSVIAHMNDEDFVIQLPELWGGERCSLKDVPFDAKVELYNKLLDTQHMFMKAWYLDMYDRFKHVIYDMKDSGIDIPYEFVVSTEYSLNYLLEHTALDYARDGNPDPLFKLLDEIERLGFTVKHKNITLLFQNLVENKLECLAEKLDIAYCKQAMFLKEISDRLCLPVKETRIQHLIFNILNTRLPAFLQLPETSSSDGEVQHLVQQILVLAYHFNFEIDHFRKKIKVLPNSA